MIELDDTNVEYVRCTCLDRARIALRQSGQHHCAQQMEELQKEFDYVAKYTGYDPSRPVELLSDLFEYWDGYGKVEIDDSRKRSHTTS